MKIALIINELNVRGGTHKQLQRLAQYLQDKGHKVKIFTKFYDKTLCFPEIEKFDIVSYEKYFKSTKPMGIGSRFKQLQGYIKIGLDIKDYSNVINIHDNGFAVTQLFFKIIFKNINVIWQINDLPSFVKTSDLASNRLSFLDKISKKIYIYCARAAYAITVNVSKNADQVKKYYNVRAEVFYCGVDLRYTKLEKSLSSKKNIIKLLSIGVFFPYRNYEIFLQVINYLNIVLQVPTEGIIVGSTVLAPDYVKKIENLISTGNIKCQIRGNISEEHLIKICNDSDVFLFVNKDQSWGLAVFEAMNMGIPVIVSESVGATELLENNKNAIIVNPDDYKTIADKIRSLMIDEEFRTQIIANAFQYTSDMTWDIMYSSKMEKLFYKALNDKNNIF